jgi:hypothetical protein
VVASAVGVLKSLCQHICAALAKDPQGFFGSIESVDEQLNAVTEGNVEALEPLYRTTGEASASDSHGYHRTVSIPEDDLTYARSGLDQIFGPWGMDNPGAHERSDCLPPSRMREQSSPYPGGCTLSFIDVEVHATRSFVWN